MGLLDDQTIDIPCKNCGRKHKKKLSWLRSNSKIECPCGTTLQLNAGDLNRKVTDIDRTLRDLGFKKK